MRSLRPRAEPHFRHESKAPPKGLPALGGARTPDSVWLRSQPAGDQACGGPATGRPPMRRAEAGHRPESNLRRHERHHGSAGAGRQEADGACAAEFPGRIDPGPTHSTVPPGPATISPPPSGPPDTDASARGAVMRDGPARSAKGLPPSRCPLHPLVRDRGAGTGRRARHAQLNTGPVPCSMP
jgi:hypothetical protein